MFHSSPDKTNMVKEKKKVENTKIFGTKRIEQKQNTNALPAPRLHGVKSSVGCAE